ncbi:hypothetical protein PR048_010411 [Dryococelus australis]|uniref:NYN domain-containing protein n=1 Tax=Dryococelus australis TaxID=614101 RepID=A0ABQ9I346_9NEOP|nr:hypothetical protein PR048_010411 [Dryococelus australis]
MSEKCFMRDRDLNNGGQTVMVTRGMRGLAAASQECGGDKEDFRIARSSVTVHIMSKKLYHKKHNREMQHVELRDSRRSRDGRDIKKFLNLFSVHQPFPTVQVLQYISTGVVADEDINCNQATTIGENSRQPHNWGENISADCKVVVNGGHLLHALVWPRPTTFDQICEAYVTFVQKHFSLTATVVFDGYDKCTTKGEERRRWSAGRSSTDISIAANNAVMSMEVGFLRKGHNKNGLIKLLVTYFRSSVHHAIQCSGDADTTIAAIALQYDTSCGVKVISTDTDILAMLNARADEGTHIEVLHPTSDKITGKIFSISAIQQDIGEMKNYILFCHAMTGSDTTSTFFGKGKKQAWNIIKSDVSIRNTVDVFMRPNADKMDIISAGEKFIMSFNQGHDNYATLDESRVQEWIGHSLGPVVWGCKSVSGTLVPISTSLPPAPEQLLKLISCNCTCDCSYSCECMWAGLQCGIMCAKWRGATCTNTVVINNGSDGDDF